MVCKLLILGSEKGQDQIEEQPMANFKLLPNPFTHKTQQSQMLYTSVQVLKSLVKKHSCFIHSILHNNNRCGADFSLLSLSLVLLYTAQRKLLSAGYH